MPSHFIDYEIQQDVFSTKELRDIFDERSRSQRWLDIEAALAFAQGEAGVIPAEAAREISQRARLDCLDLEAIRSEYQVNRNSLLPVLKGLRSVCQNGYGEFVHYGVTTQDIIDTGQILEIKQMLAIIFRDLRTVEGILINIAETHCETPMIGRTHNQYAIPLTFGSKVSVWIAEIRRHIERILSLSKRVLVGQLSGAVGTNAVLGDKAQEVGNKTLGRLGLKQDIVAWHTARDNVVEVCACFSIIAGTMAKIANEIIHLSGTDILELRESTKTSSSMSSSTMPHKSNPVLCERVVVLSRHARALLGVVMESLVHEGERDPRSLWAEWLSFPQIAIYTGTALGYVVEILAGLEVHPEQMRNNLYKLKDFVVSEYLLFALGRSIGKMNAQEKLHQLIQFAQEHGASLRDLLSGDAELSCHLTEEDLKMLEHPEFYIGQAKNIVETVVANVKEKRGRDCQELFSDAGEHC